MVSLQIALFWESKLDRPDLFANRINSRLGNVFDAMPQIIPIPANVPVDVPVVQIGSMSKGIQLNVARSRCDLLLNMDLLNQTSLANTIQKMQDVVLNYISSVYEENLNIVRMGIISIAFEQMEDATEYLTNQYFGATMPKYKELSIRINQGGKVLGMEINNILEVSAGNLINEQLGINEQGIVYQRDINNVSTGEQLSIKAAKELWKHALTFLTDKKMGVIK